MSVTSETTVLSYASDGATVGPYPLTGLESFADTDIKLTVNGAAWTDFTISVDGLRTGTVMPLATALVIYRETPKTQAQPFPPNTTPAAEDIAAGLDKVTLVTQELGEEVDRSIKPAVGATFPVSTSLGIDAAGATVARTATEEAAFIGITTDVEAAAASAAGAAASAAIAEAIVTDGLPTSVKYYNVMDYGAVADMAYGGSTIDPNGPTATDWDAATDNSLAFQRALCAAAGVPNAASLTYADTETWSGVADIPTLLVGGEGNGRVIVPPGKYKITRPITVNAGYWIEGENAQTSEIIPDYRAGYFNVIESRAVMLQRDYPFEATTAVTLNRDLHIRDLKIRCIEYDKLNGASQIPVLDELAYTPWPANIDTPVKIAAASAGVTQVTTTAGAPGQLTDSTLYVGDKFKIFDVGLPTPAFIAGTYVVSEVSDTVIIFDPLLGDPILADDIIDGRIMNGIPAANAIVVEGGENSEICNVWKIGFRTGCGVYVPSGSPGPIITNGMSSYNKFGYWFETGPCLLLRPSGDGNMTHIRAGKYKFTNLTVLGHKMERLEEVPTAAEVAGSLAPIVYPSGPVYEFGSASTQPSHYLVEGGTLNDPSNSYTTTKGKAVELVKMTEQVSRASVTIRKLKSGQWGGHTFRSYPRYGTATTVATEDIPQNAQTENDFVRKGTGAASHHICALSNNYTPNSLADIYEAVDSGTPTLWSGAAKMLDRGSGVIDLPATYVRVAASTLVTITCAGHGLVIGDYVLPYGIVGTSGGSTIWGNAGGANELSDSWGNNYFRVQTVVGNDFTITVLNSGTLTGSCELRAHKFSVVHDVKYSEHRFQMPNEGGNTFASGERRAFSFYSKAWTLLATFIRPAAGLMDFWLSGKLLSGGSVAAPTVTVDTAGLTSTRTVIWPEDSGDLIALPHGYTYVDDAGAGAGTSTPVGGGTIAIGEYYIDATGLVRVRIT
tara:strand:- start:28658 stop:31516 length:2859 start_codon:yes stop_codon:yes gene_type:complete